MLTVPLAADFLGSLNPLSRSSHQAPDSCPRAGMETSLNLTVLSLALPFASKSEICPGPFHSTVAYQGRTALTP